MNIFVAKTLLYRYLHAHSHERRTSLPLNHRDHELVSRYHIEGDSSPRKVTSSRAAAHRDMLWLSVDSSCTSSSRIPISNRICFVPLGMPASALWAWIAAHVGGFFGRKKGIFFAPLSFGFSPPPCLLSLRQVDSQNGCQRVLTLYIRYPYLNLVDGACHIYRQYQNTKGLHVFLEEMAPCY